jgi:pyruvate dehydrogenase kinase 2/3/4
LLRPAKAVNGREAKMLSQATKNPSIKTGQYRSEPDANGAAPKVPATRRYYVPSDEGDDWPPELNAYNKKFAETLEKIKRRHDSVVTTVGKTVITPKPE